MIGTGPIAAERNRLEATIAPISETAIDCRLVMEIDISRSPWFGSGTIPQPCQGYCIARAKRRKRLKSAISGQGLPERQIYAPQKAANFTNFWAAECGRFRR